MISRPGRCRTRFALPVSVAGELVYEGDCAGSSGFADGRVDEVAVVGVDADGKASVVDACLVPALVGEGATA